MIMSDDFIEGVEFHSGHLEVADEFDPEQVAASQAKASRFVVDKAVAGSQRLERIALAYRRVFGGNAQPGDAEIVVVDMAVFCSGHSSPFSESTNTTFRNIGRKEVYQRVLDLSCLDHDTLMKLYLSEATQ